MKIVYSNIFDTQPYVATTGGNRVRVGRDSRNDLVLHSDLVPEQAAEFVLGDSGATLIALSPDVCRLEGTAVEPGRGVELRPGQVVEVFPYHLVMEGADTPVAAVPMEEQLDEEMAELIKSIHVHLLEVMDFPDDDSLAESSEYHLTVEQNLEEIARLQGLTDPAQADLVTHIAGHCARSSLIEQVIEHSQQECQRLFDDRRQRDRLATETPECEQQRSLLLAALTRQLNLDGLDEISRQMRAVEQEFWGLWQQTNIELYADFLLYLAFRELKKQIKDILFGYGPLEDLLRMPTISEIMVVRSDRIYIEKDGVIENSGRRFVSDDVSLAIIERIVSKVNRRIDKAQPLVDARLSDGSRVNAVIPPLAISGPCLTVRKFPLRRFTMESLIEEKGTLTRTVAEFLRAAVVDRRNILIAGGTGSGKTTLLNSLVDFVPDRERIVTIEDTAELQIDKQHVVRMETKPANAEGAGEVTIRDLVKNALRMRPDRIIVGECRGGEALDMLQAMNTGHDGSLTTIHANTPLDVQLRLEVMVRIATELPIDSIQRQIAAAVDLIVQLRRLPGGRRCVSHVTEATGVDGEFGGVKMKDLFVLEHAEGATQSLVPTGRLPTFMGRLIEQGLIQLESFYL